MDKVGPKIWPSLGAAFLAAALFLAAPAGAESPGSGEVLSPGETRSFTISREMFEAFKAAPKTSAQRFFEGGAERINRGIDKRYADRPRAERPYLTPRRLAEVVDSMVKGYRAGHTALLEELAARVPVEGDLEEKVAFLEQITALYLNR